MQIAKAVRVFGSFYAGKLHSNVRVKLWFMGCEIVVASLSMSYWQDLNRKLMANKPVCTTHSDRCKSTKKFRSTFRIAEAKNSSQNRRESSF